MLYRTGTLISSIDYRCPPNVRKSSDKRNFLCQKAKGAQCLIPVPNFSFLILATRDTSTGKYNCTSLYCAIIAECMRLVSMIITNILLISAVFTDGRLHIIIKAEWDVFFSTFY